MSNITENCPLLNQKCKRRKIDHFNSSSDYFFFKGITYNLLDGDQKPPDPKNGKYEWIWWDDRWIEMYNDVFEEDFGTKLKNCCRCF